MNNNNNKYKTGDLLIYNSDMEDDTLIVMIMGITKDADHDDLLEPNLYETFILVDTQYPELVGEFYSRRIIDVDRKFDLIS